jgi:predicted RecA/RadA family phage recombinase
MATNFVQPGNYLTFTAAADYTAGDVVVIGSLLGIAVNDIDYSEDDQGVVALSGVFECPKVAGHAWTNGQKLTWDLTGIDDDPVAIGAFDTTADITAASGDISTNAIAFGAAAEAATTGYVKINCDVGTVETGS